MEIALLKKIKFGNSVFYWKGMLNSALRDNNHSLQT